MANTNKPPRGVEFEHLKLQGLLVEKGTKALVKIRDHAEFAIPKAQLGAVLYDDGNWGYGLLQPGKLFREIQLPKKVAKEQGFA